MADSNANGGKEVKPKKKRWWLKAREHGRNQENTKVAKEKGKENGGEPEKEQRKKPKKRR